MTKNPNFIEENRAEDGMGKVKTERVQNVQEKDKIKRRIKVDVPAKVFVKQVP